MLVNALIIDDDEKLCLLLSKNLYKNNINNVYCTSTAQAKEIINFFSFNIILIDYLMPNEDGLQFITWLSNNNCNLPVIMLTAVNNDDIKINALKLGAFDYLTKPFNVTELILKINKLALYYKKEPNNALVYKDLSLSNNTLTSNNNSVMLSDTESIILQTLINNKDSVISKEKLMQVANLYNDNNLFVTIMRLRNKMITLNNKLDYIKTIRSKGFIIKK